MTDRLKKKFSPNFCISPQAMTSSHTNTQHHVYTIFTPYYKFLHQVHGLGKYENSFEFLFHQFYTIVTPIYTIVAPIYAIVIPWYQVLGLAKCKDSFEFLLHQPHGLRLLRHPHAGPQQGVILSAVPNGYPIPARYPKFFQYPNPPDSVLNLFGYRVTRNIGYTRI